ncbi:MAG: hypothetical protein A3F72_13550 [Bacteroidetes bacterium RIFCSPLOWO2_12_FULL_35_15]|nr:MAG: hypothetical protein A3F72_13550 [Bacteroidetes bacterium RIFCSPLOWO2_12_FULL_35_15]
MKKILLILLLFLTANSFLAQSINSHDIIAGEESKNSKYFSYTDPAFPIFDFFANKGDYKRALEAYAKNHPPIPKPHITGNKKDDAANYKIILDNWFKNNPYFPRFIEYHLFQKNLTLEDDIEYYEKAVKVWSEHQKTVQK